MARNKIGFDYEAMGLNQAVNSVARDFQSMMMPRGIGGGKPRANPLANSGTKQSLGKWSSAFGGSNQLSMGGARKNNPLSFSGTKRGGFSDGFGTGMVISPKFAGQNFNNLFGAEFTGTNPMGRQYLEAQAKKASSGSGSSGGTVTGGNPNGANVDRVNGALQHKDLLMQVAAESGVPWEVLAATMSIETGGVNEPKNRAGAMGLMQVVGFYDDGTPLWQPLANQYGGDLMDPYTNVRTAAEILKIFMEQYGQGDWERAAAAYFGGGGAFNDDGSYSDSADYFGTDIPAYVNQWKNNYAYIAGQGGGSGQGVNHSGAGLVFPVKGYQGGVDLHWGEHPGAADIFAPPGTDVLAINGGTAQSGYSEIGGYWTMITGDDGLLYYYAHQDRMGPNGRIEKGGYIGGVGNTGNAATTPHHVHLGIATQGHGIINGAGPSGGAGDINVADFLNGTYRY